MYIYIIIRQLKQSLFFLYLIQRNCLYFALTTKPMFRYVPKFEWQENLQDFISHPVSSAIIAASLLCNSILLALQVHMLLPSFLPSSSL